MNPRSFSLTRSQTEVSGSAPIITKTATAGTCSGTAGPDVLKPQGFQAGLVMAIGNSGAEPDVDVGVAFSQMMR